MKIVAEIGINHNGSFERAKELISSVRHAVWGVKFQKLTPKVFLTPEQYNSPHPVPENSFGETYGKHKEHLEFSIQQHIELKNYAHSLGLKYGLSVFDPVAASDGIIIDPDYIKIPSCRCMDFDLHRAVLANGWTKPYHVSTGMTTESDRIVLQLKLPMETVFYATTSDYSGDGPVFFKRGFSFSCHVPEIVFGIAAAMLGSEYVEYHLTLDQSEKGTDHKISLVPDQFIALSKSAHQLQRMKPRPAELPECEIPARSKLWASSS